MATDVLPPVAGIAAQQRPAQRRRGLAGLIDRYWGYDFFISYAHADWPLDPNSCDFHLPHVLFQGLRPRFRVFLDREESQLGDALDEATNRRVAMSRHLVLVAGPRAAQSRWVLAEVVAAIQAGVTPIVIDPFGTYEGLDPGHVLKAAMGERIDLRREGRGDDELAETAVVRLAQSAKGRSIEQSRHLMLRMAMAAMATVTVVAVAESVSASVQRVRAQDRLAWERADRAAREGDFPAALSLLREVQIDDELEGWRSLALTSLLSPSPETTGEGAVVASHSAQRRIAVWRDGQLAVRQLDRDGTEQALALPPSSDAAAFSLPRSPNGATSGFSADGRHLLVGFFDGSSALWDLLAGPAPILSWPHQRARLSDDGTRLLVFGASDSIELRSLRQPLQCQLCTEIAAGRGRRLWWTPDAVMLAGDAGLWRLMPGQATSLLHEAPGTVNYQVGQDGSWFATVTHAKGSAQATLSVRPTAASASAPLAEVRVPYAILPEQQFAGLHGDCGLVALPQGRLQRFSRSSGLGPVFEDPRGPRCTAPLGGWGCAAQILPGCGHAILGRGVLRDDVRPPVWLVDLGTGQGRLMPYPAFDRSGMPRGIDPGGVKILASPDGRRAVVGTSAGRQFLWHLDAGSLAPIEDGDGGIHRKAAPAANVGWFSSDGRWMIGTSAADGEVRAWPVERPDEPLRLPATSGASYFESGYDMLTTVHGTHWSTWRLPADDRSVGREVVIFGNLSSDASTSFLVHHPYGQPIADARRMDVLDRRSGQIVGVTAVPAGADRLQRLTDASRVLSMGLHNCTVHRLSATPNLDGTSADTGSLTSDNAERSDCLSDDAGARIVHWTSERLEIRRGEDWEAAGTVLELPPRARLLSAGISRSGEFVTGVLTVSGKMELRIWRLTSGAQPKLVSMVPLDKAAITSVRAVAITNDGGGAAVIASRSMMGEPRDILLLRLGVNRLERVDVLQGHEPAKRIPVEIEFDTEGKHLRATTISPAKAFVAWDLQHLPWPVLNVDRFPGQLHDVRFGPGPAQVSLLFGTGFVRTLPISAESVREWLDGSRRVCITASQRMAWTREDRSDAQRKVNECRSGAGRPWSIARLIALCRGWDGWPGWLRERLRADTAAPDPLG